jgi:S-adenosylmethionine synthetase
MSDGFLFTSESVTEGHPDELADQISDETPLVAGLRNRTGVFGCRVIVRREGPWESPH